MLGEKAKRKERKIWYSLRRKMLNLTTGKKVTDVPAPMEFISGGKELNETKQKANWNNVNIKMAVIAHMKGLCSLKS